ncbi:helix-turn-helix transcriptional regulator [Klebsiella sp. Ap-873]|nr:helix-turn-helix transcriptional regulator [Klebsiella sp. Ap-873]
MARKIESALKLPNGWMDSIQTSKMNEDPVYSENAPSENYLVDVLDVTASAGYGDVISSEVAQRVSSVSFSKEEAATLFRKRPSESVKVITVTGDSMSGTIELGDYIFVDVDKGYFDGDGVYVFIFKGHILVKRIQLVADCYMVVADNPDYAPWEINEENEEHFKIIGRVLYCNSMKEIG